MLRVFEELLNAVPGLNVLHLRAAYFMENHVASRARARSASNPTPTPFDEFVRTLFAPAFEG